MNTFPPSTLILYSDADYSFPMDKIEEGHLVGTFLGNLNGDVALVPGRSNKALHTNGIDQWVNIGNHRDKCLGNLTVCAKGFVMALWLRAYIHVTSNVQFYVDSGGYTAQSLGITLFQKHGELRVRLRTESKYWKVESINFSINVWYHVAVVWTGEDGVQFYMNGCLCGRDDSATKRTNNQNPSFTDFIFGNKNTNLANNDTPLPAEMTLDEVRVWDGNMDEEEIWKIYTTDVQSLI